MSAISPLEELLASLPPIHIGPTWKKTDAGKWMLPKHTLGWQIVGWCSEYLLNDEGQPWRFTAEQLRFILWWYAVDERGRFVYRKGVLQRMKGWGKDPLLAAICLVELVGPSRVGWWDKDGNPVGVPHPRAWVQVTAVSQTQTVNTMDAILAMMSDKLIAAYGIKPGAELIKANRGKCRLVAVTSSYRALEGGRTTFTVLNETHHWIAGNGGIKMYETIDGNTTKSNGGTARYLAITNAYLPGEDSVAEKMRDAWQKIEDGKAVGVGFLYDSLEAHAKTPLDPAILVHILPLIRGDSVWLDIESIIPSILDTSIPASRSRRMWLNQIVAEEDALYGPSEWEDVADDDAVLAPGDEIVMGFDGGKSDDATALVALRVSDATAFPLLIEEKPDGPLGDGWTVDREKVDSAVHEAFRLYDVKGFYADVALWESYIDDWAEAYREHLIVKATGQHSIAWDMRTSLQKSTLAHERLMRAIFDVKLRIQRDPDMKRHMLNARRRENNYGVSFGKESRESPRKVDAYAALLLAYEALHDLRTKAPVKKKHSTQGWFL